MYIYPPLNKLLKFISFIPRSYSRNEATQSISYSQTTFKLAWERGYTTSSRVATHLFYSLSQYVCV